MTTSELVTPQHRNKKAIIYIRQSSAHQMVSNQESLRLQYALRQRGIELGWSDDNIEVIDSDLGTTAAGAEHRVGFKELISCYAFKLHARWQQGGRGAGGRGERVCNLNAD